MAERRPLPPRLRALVTLLSTYALVGGVVSFLGWVLDVPLLTSWDGNGISIQPNAALAVVAAASAVLLLSAGLRRPAAVLGALVALIGASVLFEHLSGLELGLDGLFLFGRTWGRAGVLAPGRMGPPGATSWTLIGTALVLASRPEGGRGRAAASALTVATAAIATFSLVGYLYGASSLYAIPTLTIIALQTATFILCVSLAVLLCIPERGPVLLLGGSSPASLIARRIVPAVVAVPIILGGLRLAGQRAGLYDAPFGTALRTLVEIGLFLSLLWWTCGAINRQSRRRQLADDALRTSQQRLVDTLESIADGFVTFDREWRFTYVNAVAERMLRRNRGELLGRTVWDMFPEIVGGRAYHELLRAAGSRVSVEFEEFNPVLERWFSNKASPTAGGGLAVYFEDVTVRKQAEEALRVSRLQLESELGDSQLLQRVSGELIGERDSRALYESILDAAVSLMRSECASVQMLHPERGAQGALQMLAFRGFSPEAARFWEWVEVGSATPCGAVLRTKTRAVLPDVLEFEPLAGSDDLAMFQRAGIRAVQSTPLIARSGRLVGVLSTHWREPHQPGERELRLLDILARQTADLVDRTLVEGQRAALLTAHAEQEDFLSRIIQSSPIAIAVLKGPDLEYVTVNPAYQRIVGQHVQLLGRSYRDLFPETAGRGAEESLRAVMRSGLPWSMRELETRVPGRGIATWWDGECLPLPDRAGRCDSVLLLTWEVTARRLVEAERERVVQRERAARAEAERVAQHKDEFLATLSHELRTPLNAIIGWSQLLRRDVGHPERVLAALEVIERNGRLQAQLIADLLDMSRIISGKMRLEVQRVELPLLIDAAVESMLPAAQAKGVAVQAALEPASGAVNGDPARLQQIVWNLVSNAVKFTPRGGRVQVALGHAGSRVEIRVSDTGEGIAPEFLPHIFERFSQADSSTARRHGGLGIGLALVKQLVELHGGSVRAASDGPGRGAAFVISLPLAALPPGDVLHPRPRPAPPDPGPAVRGRPPLKGVKLLLVDDEPDALELVKEMLEDCGAEVAAARSSDQALELLGRAHFDLIMSDIGMPGRNGYDLMKEARRSGVRTPALALTAFARPEDRTKALASGYQAHMSKPIDTSELLATVAALLEQPAAPAVPPGRGL